MTALDGFQRRPSIRWSPSPGSLTCELGRVGTRTLFSIIDRRYEFALHPRIPGRDGITLGSESFSVHDRVGSDQPREAARERARARAVEMWHEFLLDLAMSKPAEEQPAS